MSQFNGYRDWIVNLGDTWSEPCETLEEAQEVADYYPGAQIYRRDWTADQR